MRNDKPFTMVAPSAGFTFRVMMRLAERERAQAQRRALLGSALLATTALGVLALIAWWSFAFVAALVSTPSALALLLNALGTVAFWMSKFAAMVWSAASVIVENVGAASVLGLAIGVFALTMVWVRVVVGPFQLALRFNHAGGSK